MSTKACGGTDAWSCHGKEGKVPSELGQLATGLWFNYSNFQRKSGTDVPMLVLILMTVSVLQKNSCLFSLKLV